MWKFVSISSWLPTVMREHQILIIVGSFLLALVSLLSSIITIGGFDMPSFWSHVLVGIPYYATAVVLNTIITFVVILLAWIQYRERARLNQELASKQKNLDDLTKKCQNDERDNLIVPLYLSLDSNRDAPIKGIHLVFDRIKRYSYLAQPELQNFLKQYCEIREENPKPEDRAPSYQWDHQRRLTETINQIGVLVEKRYKELMWGEQES
jgi:hypothetical protein